MNRERLKRERRALRKDGHTTQDGTPKVAFPTLQEAIRHANGLAVYQCSVCGQWHRASSQSWAQASRSKRPGGRKAGRNR